MRRVVSSLLVCALAARGEEPGTVADRVVAAFAAHDEAALRALAEKDDPDPWLVADELVLRGAFEEAVAFAGAAPRVDTAKLPEYVGSQRGRPYDADALRALEAANASLRERKWADALASLDEAKPAEGAVLRVRLDHGRGLALRGLAHREESAAAFCGAAEAAEALGWLAGAARGFLEAGVSCRGDFRRALGLWERELALHERRGDRAGVARTLGNIGNVHENLGDYLRALDFQERSLALMEELGDRAGVARALGNMGNIRASLSDYAQSLDFLERALALMEGLGDRAGVASALGSIGVIHWRRGDHAKALHFQERSLRLKEELGDRAGIAVALGNMGLIHGARGDYAAALGLQQRSLNLMEELGNRAAVARTLASIGVLHARLGDHTRAVGLFERSLKLREELGDRAGAASTLGNIGSIHFILGDYEKALGFQNRSLMLKEELGARAAAAGTLGNIGLIHERLGDYAKALDIQARVLRLQEELGDRGAAAGTLVNIGSIHRGLGDHAKALHFEERALALAGEIGLLETTVRALLGIACTHRAARRPRDAMAAARRSVDRMSRLAAGHSEEMGAAARGEFLAVFEVGASAAVDVGDAGEALFFLESGRAGTLLESLRVREALQSTELPPELLAAETATRARETAAAHALRRALGAGDRAAIQSARAELDAAREDVGGVIERIQRETKAVASVAYPKADAAEAIEGRLRGGEALVLYGLLGAEFDEAVALVVTAVGARIVVLGKARDVEAACRALRVEDEKSDVAEATAALRKLVVDPLGLDPKTTRLLVSPDGALSYIPFSLLAPEKEIVYVPSGTSYGVLLDDAAKRGEGVLAVGDPECSAAPDPDVVAMRGGHSPVPLPATREEAKAVGTVTLLGKEATEQGLRAALGKRPRWRAVHLACHGLVDPERPMLSSLALTPAGEEDGFLTALDVFRMKVPADLAVLSACETGKGKVYRAEGIVGLTRAFMFAGAPRVLVSLWKVDDEATRALMVKFYEGWDAGKAAAGALKEAQAYVRSQERWRHPRFWAAWVLWGLPE